MESIKTRRFLAEGSCIFKKNYWRLALINLLIVIIFLALFALLAICFGVAFNSYNPYDSLPIGSIILIALFFLALILLMPVLGTGYYNIYVRLSRNEKASFKDIFKAFSHFWPIWLTQYFTMILIMGGVFLLLLPLLIIFFMTIGVDMINNIPIINSAFAYEYYSNTFLVYTIIFSIISIISSAYWGIKFMFTAIAGFDKKLKPAEAVFYGSQITNNYKMKIFLALLLPIILLIIFTFVLMLILGEESVSYNIIINIVNIFIYSPWVCSIIGSIYVKLADNYDKNPPSRLFINFQTGKNTSTLEDNEINIDNSQDNVEISIDNLQINEEKKERNNRGKNKDENDDIRNDTNLIDENDETDNLNN